MKEFALLDLALMLTGCKLLTESPVSRLANLLFLTIMVTVIVSTAILNIKTIAVRGGFAVMSAFARYIDLMSGSLFIIIMIKNRGPLVSSMAAFAKPLSLDQRRSLTSFSRWSLAFLAVTTLHEIIALANHLRISHTLDQVMHITADTFRTYLHLNSWFLTGALVYTFCIRMICMTEENYFKRLSSSTQLSSVDHHNAVADADAVNHDGSYDIPLQEWTDNAANSDLKLALERKQMMLDRKAMLSFFSFIPLLWFIYLFVKSTVVFIELTERYDNIGERLWRGAPLFFEISVTACLVYYCDQCVLFTRKQSNALIRSIMQNGQVKDIGYFVAELKASARSEFSVFETFDISRSFMLAFISSLISFTVLFLDVIYDYIITQPSSSAAAANSSTITSTALPIIASNCTCPLPKQ